MLLRDHGWVVSISLPLGHGWAVRTHEEWRRTRIDLPRALASLEDEALSIADAVAAFRPVLARTASAPGSSWELRVPGTPVPSEAWLRNGDQGVGLFQERRGVRVVVWVSTSCESRWLGSPAMLAESMSWLTVEVQRQAAALEAAAIEAKRKAALPLPDCDAIVALLKTGARIQTSGGRYHETFFWNDGLWRDVFDEGDSYVLRGTLDDLRSHVALYPDVFRAALAASS